MLLSLCMIVKNEEENIKECLDRALKIVDEAIIVDTGSTDNTIDILKDYEDKNKIKVVEYKWENDFSKARNKSIEKAKGDYILVLDADERIFCNREKLEQTVLSTDKMAYIIPIYNIFENRDMTVSSGMVRLYKNANPLYEGAIHEQIKINGSKYLGKLINDEICKIYHYGYSKNVFKSKNKEKRNKNIIDAEIKRNPDEPFNWYNKGVMEMIANRHDVAMDDFIKAHKLTKRVRMSYHNDLIIRMVQCMLMLKRYKQTNQFIKTLINDKYISKMPDIYYYQGISYKELRDFKKAIISFKKAIDIGEYNKGISKFGSGSFLPLIKWAETLKAIKKIDEAIDKYKEAVLHTNNVNNQGLNELKQLLLQENRKKEMEKFEESIIIKTYLNNKEKGKNYFEEQMEEFKKNIQVLIEKGLLNEAQDMVKEYEKIIEKDIEIYSIKAVIAMMNADIIHAEKILKKGLSIDCTNFDLNYNLAYLYQSTEKKELAIEYYKKAFKNADKQDEDAVFNILKELGVKESKEEILKEFKRCKKLKVVFFPYKVTMWDSMATIYDAFIKDKNCLVKVVPIPYYQLSQDKEIPTYEGDRFPEDTPISHYNDYNIEEEKPDIIFVHNIYDQYNTITRVYEQFFTSNLKKYTDMLVYVPYHIPSLFYPYTKKAIYMLRGIKNVDKVILISDFLKKAALEDGIPESKLLNLGSPKIDSMVNNLRKSGKYPDEWKDKLKGKTVYALDTGCLYFVNDMFSRIEEITKILNIPNMNKDTAVIWRPHPLTRTAIRKYIPQLMPYYDNLIENQIKGENATYKNVIFDETDNYLYVLNAADTLIARSGSLLGAFLLTEKKIIFLDKDMPKGSVVEKDTFYYFYNEEEPWHELIERLTKGEDPLENNRKGLASKIYKNVDGTSGKKIYETIKELVLKS